MKKFPLLLMLLILASYMAAQDRPPAEQQAPVPSSPAEPAASAPPQASPLQAGSLIYAELSKSIDSKKAKVGDPVTAKVTQAVLSHGKIAIPRNTKIIGHLTAAQARTKDQKQAQLGIVFDRAELKNGDHIPLASATIQAVASALSFDQSPSTMGNAGAGPDTSGMSTSRPGANMGGMNSPMGGSQYPSNPGTGSADPTTGTGTASGLPAGSSPLNASSRGVVGMPGVKLQPQAQGGLVSVEGKNVKLESGTQLVLRTP